MFKNKFIVLQIAVVPHFFLSKANGEKCIQVIDEKKNNKKPKKNKKTGDYVSHSHSASYKKKTKKKDDVRIT